MKQRPFPFLFAGIALLAAALPAAAQVNDYAYTENTMSSRERLALDLSDWVVTDRDASYLDVPARRALLAETSDPLLRDEAERLSIEVGCQALLNLPVIDYDIELPSFYAQPHDWRRLVQPTFAFEAAVSDLAAAHVSSSDRYHADCLVDFLRQWADQRAFETYSYSSADRQAWHQVEAAIFSSAMAYSIVRPTAADRPDDLAAIEAWLLRLSRRHVSFSGGTQSCCNNHLYRRATYATMVGVLTGDNRMFQFGVGGILSALHDAGPDGALPHEMQRGRLAAHYQNFALIYLVMAAQIIERQGYDILDFEYEGSTLHDLVEFNTLIFEDLSNLGEHAPADLQRLDWRNDDQYLAWMEIYNAAYPSDRLEALIAERRPLLNRSTGGHLSLLFKAPEVPESPDMSDDIALAQ